MIGEVAGDVARAARLAERQAELRQQVQQRAAELRGQIAARMAGPQPPAQVAVRGGQLAPQEIPDAPELLRQVLEETGLYLMDYVEFPSRSALVAVLLWIAHAAARDGQRDLIWWASPRLMLTSAENGSGKSTLLEAIAVACGFNPEGGSNNFNFATQASHSSLHSYLRIIRGHRRPRTGWFLRAESFYNVASNIDRLDAEPGRSPRLINAYGGISLHKQSHGESFITLLTHRFSPSGLYLLDEPEAALSPSRQLAALVRIHELVKGGAQFVIATHSPILMSYPDAQILRFDSDGITPVDYTDTEHFLITRDFLADHRRALRRLLDDDNGGSGT